MSRKDTRAERSSSVRVIDCLNPSQLLPPLMHVGNWAAVVPVIKRSVGVAQEVISGNVHYIRLHKTSE